MPNDKQSIEESPLHKIGPVYDASILSDECAEKPGGASFTGAFVGMACTDMNFQTVRAEFDHFIYRPVKHQSDRYDVQFAH